jgi:hydroxymethylpyrimidine pyrophosphatase-like HAD family hydrolase
MAIICDIDDTLLRAGTHPIEKTINYLKTLDGPVYIVTGRPESDRGDTARALHAAGVTYSRLIMNPYSSANTAKFKKEVADRLKGKVTLAIDNNANMRSIYSAVGIKTLDPAKIPDVKKMWSIFNN